ncbi:MAG: hypothetical protein K8R89_02035 [Anaerolineae bacterium]|nr:hypothetical protein [Anaerolineae bacterium]
MLKRLRMVGLLVALLLGGTPVLAQGPILPQHSDPSWAASYWNNTMLSGTPALTRQDANINFNWGTGSPDVAVSADQFSARWTRYIDVTPSTYRFTVTSDDGIRVWIDNKLLLDKWGDHPPTTFTFDTYLGSGHHYIKVEYYENCGLAVAELSWAEKDSGDGGEWKAEYFNNMTLGGAPALTRYDRAVNFNWGTGSPAAAIQADHFSARWTRTVELTAGMYTFSLTVDDGARFWVNGHLLVDAWYEQHATTYTDEIYLPGGPVTIELQYYENGGHAVAQLAWNGEDPSPSDGVIVDENDPGFVKGGTANGWRTVNEGHGGRMLWTYNNSGGGYNYNWARWYPNLSPAYYEVFVFIPYRYTTTAQARYWVRHTNGYKLRIVNQSTQGDQWVSLGTYYFSGDGSEYVSLADVTYEPYRTRLIGFDAVKWVQR